MDFSADEYARRDRDRLAEILTGPPVTWVFAGDSITQAVVHTDNARGFVEHFAERVRGELGRLGDAVINSGVSGSKAEELLPEFHWRIGRFAPDVVFVMFGTNDCVAGPDGVRSYRYQLDQILTRVRDLGATPVLQTPPPVQQGEGRDPAVLAAYAAAVRELASDRGVLVVDHFERWDEQAPDDLMSDSFHPNARGHERLYSALADAVGVDARDSRIAKAASGIR